MEAKVYSKLVRSRFIKAMDQLIALELVKDKVSFSEKVGLYQQNLSKIITEERYPTIEVLCNICLVFKVNPEWLLTGVGQMFITTSENGLIERITNIEKELKIIPVKKTKSKIKTP